MRTALKRAVVGTPFEPLARGVATLLEHLGLLKAPDSFEQDIENVWLEQIMRRTLKTDSNCIDVGCSVGAILDRMIACAPTGRHVAFEPLPFRARDLREKFPKVEVFNMALADYQGTSEFHHVVDDTGYSGLKQRQYPSEDMKVEKIQVQVNRLDDVLPDRKFDFLKIDVEGAELQVLRGAIETIRAHRMPIAFEHGPGASNHYGTTPEMIFDFFAGQCGYELFLYPDWLEGRAALNEEQFVAEYGGKHWNFLAHP